MELIFIRHGQGVHNTDVPDRLNIENPHLTDRGKNQVENLKSTFTFEEDDLFVVSPTIRNIETANIITSDLVNPKKYITPFVGPRMFPLPENPESYISKCDKNYSIERIEIDHSEFIAMNKDDIILWNDGINAIEQNRFNQIGIEMIDWIKAQGGRRTFIIAHDGTITSYRQLLSEERLTRSDFVGEAGWYKIDLVIQ